MASVLRDGMSTPRRQNVHRSIIHALEKIHPNDFSLLAYHCREAGENELAASYYHKAGDLAMRAFAHEDAIRFYSEALSVAPPDSVQACQLLLARAKVYDLRGERALQFLDLQAAETKADAIKDEPSRAAVALARGEYAIQMTEQPEVIEFAKRAIALSEHHDLPSITAQAYMLWGRALSEMGELIESREHLLHAARIAREAGLGLIEARSMINSGNIDYRLGDYDAAREKYLISLKTIRALGERRIECMVINNLGNIQWVQGDLETALHSYKQTLEIARSIGDRLNEARGLSNIGSILTEQFQYPEAIEALGQALPILRELGQHVDESVVLGHLGDVMESLGRYDEAYKYKGEAQAIMKEAEDPQGEAEMLTGISRIETFRGNVESAERAARQAISIAAQHEYRVEEAAAWQQLGLAKSMDKRWDESEQAYSRALDLFDALKQESKSFELHAELAWLAHQRGDAERAKTHLDAILPGRTPDAVRNIQQPSVCWCCYEALKADQPDAAHVILKNGYKTLMGVSEKIKDTSARKHYLYMLPHHEALVQSWKQQNRK
jgi:tetratricopeptide (TPR) repeat protein